MVAARGHEPGARCHMEVHAEYAAQSPPTSYFRHPCFKLNPNRRLVRTLEEKEFQKGNVAAWRRDAGSLI